MIINCFQEKLNVYRQILRYEPDLIPKTIPLALMIVEPIIRAIDIAANKEGEKVI